MHCFCQESFSLKKVDLVYFEWWTRKESNFPTDVANVCRRLGTCEPIMNTIQVKLCKKCNRYLDTLCFHAHKRSKDGLRHYCKDCFKQSRPRYVVRNCATCQKPFNAPVKEINRGNGRYCSIPCGRHHVRPIKTHEPNVACAYCNTPFWRRASNMSGSKSGLYFCCREHKDAAQRIGGIEAIQPDHYGTTLKDYRDIAFRNLTKICNRCGYDKFVVVHHKDRNHSNNDLSNLEILCPNCHALEHWAKKSN